MRTFSWLRKPVATRNSGHREEAALLLHFYHTFTPFLLHFFCTITGLLPHSLHFYCTFTELLMHFYCIFTALLLNIHGTFLSHFYRTFTALLQNFHGTFLLHFYCTFTALLHKEGGRKYLTRRYSHIGNLFTKFTHFQYPTLNGRNNCTNHKLF